MTRLTNYRFLTAAVAAAGFAAFSAVQVNAQTVVYGQPPVGAYAPAPAPVAQLTPDQIDQLTGPIALYPDPLLAQLLPAATYPNDISAAAAWLQANPQPTEDGINAQQWDPSVKAIVHYPSVFQQLAGNMDWTQALGAAFINQQQDVMDSIQRLRAEAEQVGNLAPSADQQVVEDSGCIEILPVNPQYCYVPVYDPAIVFLRRGNLRYDRCNIGGWLNFGFDWSHHWVSGGYDWVHYRPGHPIIRRPEITVHPWVHDNRRALPVMPAKFAHPVARQEDRGYKPAVAPKPGGGAFDLNQKREDINREEQRGRESHPVQPAPHVVEPPHAVAQPHVEPREVHNAPPAHVEPQHVEPTHVEPAHVEPAHVEPQHVEQPREAAPVFRPSGNAAEINQQSSRGNQSMHHH